MSRVFISYRRDDSAFAAIFIHDRLKQKFGSDIFFRDMESLDSGDKFLPIIIQEAHKCEVMIVVIGKQWLTILDQSGRRRLDNLNDILRKEIVIALERDINVIPVLIDGAKMPKPEELPDDLKPLTERNEHPIHYSSVESDVDKLGISIGKKLGISGKLKDGPSTVTTGASDTLDRNFPGNIFWLAHNIEHARLRLEWQWPKNEVLSMLDN